MSETSGSHEKDAVGRGDLDALIIKIYEDRQYDFREYKRASVRRRVTKRLFDNHLATYEQYMALLDSDPDEYARLLDTLLINVSEFFRDPEAWEIIDKEVIPGITMRKHNRDPIRIWSAGCSSGEEPYTIAILLAEKLGDAIADYDLRIYATDIDDKALSEARKCAYPTERLRNVKKEYLDKYSPRRTACTRVRGDIRQMVSFGART